jgi:2',3'-cyclic-nucleotide 2'-phosphodiesterase (5'-nucleotidase family)
MYRLSIVLIWIALLSACKTLPIVQQVSDVDVLYLRSEATTEPVAGSKIEEMIAPYREQLSEEMDQVIGEMPEELIKERPNSNLGNWFADVLHDVATIHYDNDIAFAIQNYGGLRVPAVPKGPLTKGKIFELMPFDNKLVIVDLSADQVTKLADIIAGSRGWPISRGLSLTINKNKASNILVNGQALNNDIVYHVAMPDYVANGGGGGDFLKDLSQHDTGYYIREAVIEHLAQMQTSGTPITVDNTQRIN